MAVKIRLRRTGAKGQPSYRLVIAEALGKRDGKFVESIGHYNPRRHDAGGNPELQVNAERACYWLDQGAQPTETVRSLLRRAGVLKLRQDIRHGLVTPPWLSEAAPAAAAAPAAEVAPAEA